MASTTTQNNNKRRILMARFSIDEDDDDVPLVYKRQRFSEPACQSQRSMQRSQSRVVVEGDDGEGDELIPIEEVESDSQGSEEEEEEEDEEFEEEVEALEEVGEAERVSEGQNQQQQMTSSRAGSSIRGQPNVSVASRLCATGLPDLNNANGSLQVVLTDPDVLDCPICLDPLCTPVFQCENGHIACSSCCCKVKRKCPSCCMPIGYNRCRAIEKVIESVKTSCKNARFGCTKTMSYNKKHEHEQMCPHAACFCPHMSCPFEGSSKNMYLHFGIQHAASTTRFTYNTTFYVNVELNTKHMFFQEQHESVVFILNHQVQENGRAFNVDCVGPSTFKFPFVYRLTAESIKTTLSLLTVPEVYAKWSEHTPIKNYLTVPSDFSGYSGSLSLSVCIKEAV